MIDPLILARSIHMAATVLAAGTVAFMALVVDLPALRRQLTLLVWIALAVAILSGLAWLVWLAADIYGAPIIEVCLHGGVWSVLIETRFGLIWIARLGLAILLGALMLWPAARLLQLAAAACLLGLIALIGHAGATPGTAGQIHLASDIVHLLAAGAWVGALPALAMLLGHVRHADNPDWDGYAVTATRRFSLLGMISVSALLASGVINSWNLLGGPRDLVTTDYGRLVLLKIGLFVAMVGIAAANRLHLTPQLPAAGALKALRRNSLAEFGLGLCALLFVGALGTLSPSGHAHSISTPVPSDAAFAHIHTSEAMVEITIEPGQTGPANAAIRVLRDDFSEFPAKTVQLTLEAPGAGGKITRNAAHLPDGTWQVNAVDLAQAGIWTVRLTIAPQAGPPIVLDAPIEIER
ncbi:MAG TPA: copper homeostasis membrane protein CopD [Pseudolabrys sp.]|nr:copper homeostasis membrane protein CopD [Pseudolabrys sp.]